MSNQIDRNPQRQRARMLEQETLYALGKLGVLSMSQIARWCHGDSLSSRVVMQRVVKRLKANRLIIARTDQCGRLCYFLTKPGAALLRKLKNDGNWHHGHDLGIINPLRQKQIFECAVQEHRAGHEVLGRAGMRAYNITNYSGVDLFICGEQENFGMRLPRTWKHR